jgi:hypothetical protein
MLAKFPTKLLPFIVILVATLQPGLAQNRFLIGINGGESYAIRGSSISFGASFGYRVRRELEIALNYSSIPHYEMTIASLSAMGRYPLGSRIHILGRVGIANWYESPLGTQASVVSSGVDPLIGAGVSFRLDRRISTRVQYFWIFAPSHSGLGGNFSGFGLSAIYHF